MHVNDDSSNAQTDETATGEVTTPETENDGLGDDTFPRSYVEELRRENASYRDKAKTAQARADELSRELFTAKVEATGKVENAAEIPYNADILNNPDALNAAIDAAIADRPYIKRRNIVGDAGQGAGKDRRSKPTVPQDFSELFR